MRNFLRALGYSRPHWRRLVLSMLAALGVAALWFLNLSAMYPILQIMSEEQNLQQWSAGKARQYKIQATDPTKIFHIQNMRESIDKLAAQLKENPSSAEISDELVRQTRARARAEAELADASDQQFRMEVLNKFLTATLPEERFATFLWISGLVLVGMAVKGAFEFCQEALVGSVVTKSVLTLRNRLYQSVLHQSPKQLQDIGTSDVMARLTNDAEQVGNGMKILYGKMVGEPLKMIGCVAGACAISWQVTLLFLLLVAPAVVALARVSRSMKKATRKVLEQMSGLYKVARETFDGVRVVKAFTSETVERAKFRRVTEDFYRRSLRVIVLDALTGPVVEILGFAAVSIALLAGAYLVMEKRTDILGVRMTAEPMTFQTLLMLYLYLGMIADPVRRLSSVYNKIQAGAAAADRVFALQDREPSIAANATGPVVPPHAREIEFRNVSFSYIPGQDPGTLNAVSLRVKAGERIALVGPNGCGKSTLVGLLARFHDPDHGAVLVDGVNLRTANLRSLRRQIGLVTQDTMLFHDTIAANIRYGKPNATDAEVESAARQAQAHEFIVEKPLGYLESVGEGGSQLSGGQKQRLALARAILRDPRILILDEFTSQIDAESEAKIHRVLGEFTEHRTTFIITHRLNTLDLADRIVVMDAGRIVSVGTHAELHATSPVYRRLYDAQLGTGESLRIADDDAAA